MQKLLLGLVVTNVTLACGGEVVSFVGWGDFHSSLLPNRAKLWDFALWLKGNCLSEEVFSWVIFRSRWILCGPCSSWSWHLNSTVKQWGHLELRILVWLSKLKDFSTITWVRLPQRGKTRSIMLDWYSCRTSSNWRWAFAMAGYVNACLASNAAVNKKLTGLKLTLKVECVPPHVRNCHEESLDDSLPEKRMANLRF